MRYPARRDASSQATPVASRAWRSVATVAASGLISAGSSSAATARAVDDSHFDALYEAYLGDSAVRDFMLAHNPDALVETRRRFREAIERGLWRPRRNSIREALLGGADE